MHRFFWNSDKLRVVAGAKRWLGTPFARLAAGERRALFCAGGLQAPLSAAARRGLCVCSTPCEDEQTKCADTEAGTSNVLALASNTRCVLPQARLITSSLEEDFQCWIYLLRHEHRTSRLELRMRALLRD